MDANELTFGIEIETTVPAGTIQIGGYRHGVQVPYLPEGWTASRDGSIRAYGVNTSCEIVSPVLKGYEGLQQVKQVLDILKKHKHHANQSCGIHVHVGFTNTNASPKQLERLLTIVAYLEKAIYAVTGTRKREESRWCKSIKRYGKQYAHNTIRNDRYHLVNIQNLRNNKGTVEFRTFPSVLKNGTMVCAWIQMCLGIVEKALTCKRSPSWNGTPIVKSSVWSRENEAETEVERLFAYLCWGNYGKHPSHLKPYGWIDDIGVMEIAKKILRTNAKQYVTT
jgi:hypothetical protein